MQYKTELHLHTDLVSPCADLPYTEAAERYLEAGYTTIVVTDHYSRPIVEREGRSWEESMDHFLSGYRAMKEYLDGRANVLLGCELRFDGSRNDYLIFGVTEEFLRQNPTLNRMSVPEFSAFARENSLLFVQAHPFRNSMTVVKPHFLDGIEVFNGHKGHDSRNFIAHAYAKHCGLIPTSGTDFHHPDSVISGGILTDAPITSVEQLVAVLKSRDYTLICEGPCAKDGDLHNIHASEL